CCCCCPSELQKDKEKAQRKGDLKEEAALCNQLGGILARHGRFEEALEEHRQELRLLESVDDAIGCAVAHRKIGECLAELESYEAALKHQRRHLDLARSLCNPIEQQRAWATIGRTYMFMAESDPSSEALQEAEAAFMKSLQVLEEQLEGEVPQREASEMRARLYLNLGLVYDSLKNPSQHAYYIKKSIYISEQTQLHEDLYRAYFNLGNIHLREGEHSKAMRCLERARECACKMKEKYMESECCVSIAQVLLSLGDFVAAKRSLKKAYRLGSQQPPQRESVCRSLRYGEWHRRSLGGQQWAAGCPGLFATAVWVCLFPSQLCHARSLKRPDQELAVIHVSLAATFGDLKDHAQAIKHYQAELALRKGNPLEEGKTWLNIALSKEEAKESYEELQRCFQTALSYAEEACDAKLQRQVLRHFHACQQRCGCPEASNTQARLQELCGSRGWRLNGEISEEEEEEEEAQGSEPLEESDLELSDSEDDLEGYNKTVPGRRRLNKWNQRNERGETLLHRACIDGNLRQVQFCVKKGHPLNPRDYCGWTPLHEACNHGHLEIVRFLLDHNAAIDDPGGPGCEGITPLHDALNCGHFDVAELLIHRGASVVLRNAKGLTPLGTLQAWVHLYGRDLDRETRQRCQAMERLLKRALAERGESAFCSWGSREWLLLENSEVLDKWQMKLMTIWNWRKRLARSETREKSRWKKTGKKPPASQLFDAELSESPQAPCPLDPAPKSPSPRRSWREPEEDDAISPLRPVKKRQRLFGQDPEREARLAAPAEYRAAIRGVGRAKPCPMPSPERPKSSAGPALIPPEEYVGDDWLEDDLGQNLASRKRSRHSPVNESGTESEESLGGESDGGFPRQPPEATKKRRRRVRQSRLTHIVDRTPLGRLRGAGVVAAENPECAADASILQGGGCLPTAAPLLLPCSESRPVSWLADQASQRYYQTCGLLPRLTLKKEGALLAPQDCIMDVLQSNEEVLAEVQSWDLPPLVERYRKACQSLAVGEHRLLLQLLECQESGPSFHVPGLALRRLHLTPLLRALKLQTSIRRLCLPGAGLGDDSAEELLATVATIPGLEALDLSANRLGPQGLRKLTAGLPGSNLEELDLSLNPLGDGSTQPLASLVQACPVLSTLRLQACGFTTAFLQHYRLLLASALKGAVHLRRLTVSHNALGSSALELLLKSLPSENLTHLDISSVGARPGDQQPLQDAVARYLAQVWSIRCHHLPTCLPLVSLDLSANPEIGIVGLRTLLLALEERNRGLQFLSLAGCSVRGPLDSVTWTKLSSNVSQLQLCTRHLSRSDQRDVAELWRGPPGTSLHSVTRHHKLFCHCL
uniref:Tonsoku-like protein n=1 Tax=Podarcis muralis TaxID=64176 RepID=A0A670J461_PODMU